MNKVTWMLLLFLIIGGLPLTYTAHVTFAHSDDNKVDLSNVTAIQPETKRDIELEEAFSKVYKLKRGEDKVTYYYNHIDLNGDDVPETFVYLTGPMVCGTGGCSGVLFKQLNGKYHLVSQFSLVRAPIIIRDKKTNGWRNIIMYTSGGGMPGAYKELVFNGQTYPLNPSIQPDVEDRMINGIAIISGNLFNKGIEF